MRETIEIQVVQLPISEEPSLTTPLDIKIHLNWNARHGSGWKDTRAKMIISPSATLSYSTLMNSVTFTRLLTLFAPEESDDKGRRRKRTRGREKHATIKLNSLMLTLLLILPPPPEKREVFFFSLTFLQNPCCRMYTTHTRYLKIILPSVSCPSCEKLMSSLYDSNCHCNRK